MGGGDGNNATTADQGAKMQCVRDLDFQRWVWLRRSFHGWSGET